MDLTQKTQIQYEVCCQKKPLCICNVFQFKFRLGPHLLPETDMLCKITLSCSLNSYRIFYTHAPAIRIKVQRVMHSGSCYLSHYNPVLLSAQTSLQKCFLLDFCHFTFYTILCQLERLLYMQIPGDQQL